MTEPDSLQQFAEDIKAASNDELREFIAELFPDSVDDNLSLPDDHFDDMRASVDRIDELDLLTDEPEPDEDEPLGAEATNALAFYEVTGRHSRAAPRDRKTDWVGSFSAVRVRVGATDGDWKDQWTPPLGWIRREDHLVHSRAGLIEAYTKQFKTRPRIDSLELITGARRGTRKREIPRFAPISLFLASAGGKPQFYAVESADVQGKPKKLFIARSMADSMSGDAGYSYTFMARRDNQFHGKLEMDANNHHPWRFHLEVRLGQEPQPRPHLRLAIVFTPISRSKATPVFWGHFWTAVRRACAIAYPMGYHPNNKLIKRHIAALAKAGRQRESWYAMPASTRPSTCRSPYVNCCAPRSVAAAGDSEHDTGD